MQSTELTATRVYFSNRSARGEQGQLARSDVSLGVASDQGLQSLRQAFYGTENVAAMGERWPYWRLDARDCGTGFVHPPTF